MSVPRVTQPPAQARVPQRTGIAMAVIVTGALAVAFTAGLHAAFYALTGFMVLAAVLSALRAGPARTRTQVIW